MKVLILGNSDIVQRKIVPTIIKTDSISSYDISTTSNKKLNKNKLESTYKDYSLSILDSNADTVYVSLPNNLHYKFSKKVNDMKGTLQGFLFFLLKALCVITIMEWIHMGANWLDKGYIVAYTPCNLFDLFCYANTTSMVGVNKILFWIGHHTIAYCMVSLAIFIAWLIPKLD